MDFKYLQWCIMIIEIHATNLQYKQFLTDLNKTTTLQDGINVINDWFNYFI